MPFYRNLGGAGFSAYLISGRLEEFGFPVFDGREQHLLDLVRYFLFHDPPRHVAFDSLFPGGTDELFHHMRHHEFSPVYDGGKRTHHLYG